MVGGLNELCDDRSSHYLRLSSVEEFTKCPENIQHEGRGNECRSAGLFGGWGKKNTEG